MIHGLERSASRIPKILILFLWIACIFDPIGQIYGMKYIAIAAVCGLLAFNIATRLRLPGMTPGYYFIFFLFVIFYPAYGLFVTVFRGGFGGKFIDTSYLAAALYFICSVVYFYPGYAQIAYRSMVIALRLLSVVILISLCAVSLGVFDSLLGFFMAHGVAYLGTRNYAGINFYYIYYISSPMLVFLLCHDTWRLMERVTLLRGLAVISCAAALFLSGTRASILLAVSAPLLVGIWYYLGRKTLLVMAGGIAALALALTLFHIPVLSEMFGAGEASNSIKIGYLSQYWSLFDDTDVLLFGQGYNAHVWSAAVASLLPEGASKTELTYLELVRVFGVMGLLLFIGVVLRLSAMTMRAQQAQGWLAPAVILYCAISAINPYIFSTNGMLLFGFAAVAVTTRARGAPLYHTPLFTKKTGRPGVPPNASGSPATPVSLATR